MADPFTFQIRSAQSFIRHISQRLPQRCLNVAVARSVVVAPMAHQVDANTLLLGLGGLLNTLQAGAAQGTVAGGSVPGLRVLMPGERSGTVAAGSVAGMPPTEAATDVAAGTAPNL